MKKLFLILIITLLLANISLADNKVDLVLFHGQGCPHCAKMISFLDSVKEDYHLNIIKYEVYFNQSNRDLFKKMALTYNTEVQGVPTIFIDDKVFVGYNKGITEALEQEIKRCNSEDCNNPINKVKSNDSISIIGNSSPHENPINQQKVKTLTIPAVISAAAVDAINPCAFAVLIILLTTILAAKSRKKVLFAGIAFSVAIFVSYFLMGFGLYSAIQASGLSEKFYIIVAVLAILIGLFNLKDYLWYGKWFVMEVPLSWRPKMKMLLRGIASVPGAFLIGFVISLFLLPCTSGPYIVILGMLSKLATRNYATILLLLYNFIFILPMLIITLAIYFGFTTTEKAERWRKSKLKMLHLIAGLIILLLGIFMLVSVWLGFI